MEVIIISNSYSCLGEVALVKVINKQKKTWPRFSQNFCYSWISIHLMTSNNSYIIMRLFKNCTWETQIEANNLSNGLSPFSGRPCSTDWATVVAEAPLTTDSAEWRWKPQSQEMVALFSFILFLRHWKLPFPQYILGLQKTPQNLSWLVPLLTLVPAQGGLLCSATSMSQILGQVS